MLANLTRGVPTIHFGTGTSSLLELMREAGGDVIGVDFRVELDQAWQRLEVGDGAISILLCSMPTLGTMCGSVCSGLCSRQAVGPTIFNLGHGILPTTPVDNVLVLIDAVHERSARRHDTTAF